MPNLTELNTRAITLTAVLAAGLVAAPAWAEFGEPVTISRFEGATAPHVAMAPDGRALVAWQQEGASGDTSVRGRARALDGTFGSERGLARPGGPPRLAMDTGGNARIVWRASSTLLTCWRFADGRVTNPERVDQVAHKPPRRGSNPQIAMRANGDTLIVWQRDSGPATRILGRFGHAGTLGVKQFLSGLGGSNPSVAIDADGNAVVVWQRSDGTNTRIQARARSAAGVLGPVETLSGTGFDAADPKVATDADGNALIVWRLFDGTDFRIQGRTRSAAGVLGPAEVLSHRGQSAAEPQLVINAIGEGLVVWQRSDGTNERIQRRVRFPGGVLGPVSTLSEVGQDAVHPRVAISANRAAVIAWQGFDGTNTRIRAITRGSAAEDRFEPAQTLSEAGFDASEPQVAIAADGGALVVWQLFDGTNIHIQAAADDH